MNSGWYVVYLLMVFANAAMCNLNGFDIRTWQFWTWSAIIILTFVAGANYRKE